MVHHVPAARAGKIVRVSGQNDPDEEYLEDSSMPVPAELNEMPEHA